MVDAPRNSWRLGDAVARLGGVSYLVFAHATATVGHEAWKQRFPLKRVVPRMNLRAGSTLGVVEQ